MLSLATFYFNLRLFQKNGVAVKFTINNFNLIKNTMDAFKTYLSTAPVLLTVWMSFTAGLLIEMNRFYPDALTL